MDIVIHYDPASEDDALALARRLFAHFDEAIDSLTLVPVASEEFDLLLDGRLIHSRHASGRAPCLADLLTPVV
jgi:hypothetical protein